jgi:fatty-acyl-CoA synthase
MARKLDHPVKTTIAGAAPTATVIQGLEELGIDVTHVYGLTESYGPMTKTVRSRALVSLHLVG